MDCSTGYHLSTVTNSGGTDVVSGRLRLRRSDVSSIERARARTLKMTITIVAAFVWCWTPYVVMTLWYMFDREGASQVDTHVQDALFIMAVSNSCVNPLVYGSYAIDFKRECSRCCAWSVRSGQKLARVSTGESAASNRSQTASEFS